MAKALCGWREWVALPALGIEQIKAKVDTGARTSALHAWHVQEVSHNGAPWVRFCVHPRQRTLAGEIWCEAPIVDQRDVRNTGGRAQTRYVVETDLQIGAERFRIELTLTRRDDMGFRMLLGRTAVRGRYLVDPGRSFLVGKLAGKSTRQLTGAAVQRVANSTGGNGAGASSKKGKRS